MYTLLAPNNVDQHWLVLAPWVAKAVGTDNPWDDVEAIRQKATRGIAQVWMSEVNGELDMVLVTEGMMLEGIPTLVLRWMTALRFEDCAQDFGLLENWAFKAGYQRLQVWGRKGWEKKLRPLGFAHNFTVMDKFITRGLH